jgi:hypothetical protein
MIDNGPTPCATCGEIPVPTKRDEHEYLHCRCYDETDEDWLTGPGEVIRRGARHKAAAVRTLELVREHGPNMLNASPGLVAAARAHFQTWENACHRAGVAPPHRLT